MLAQVENIHPTVLQGIILFGLAALAALYYIVGLVKESRAKPTPNELQKESLERYATKAELKDFVSDTNNIHRQIFEKIDALRVAFEIRIDGRLDKIELESRESRRQLHRDVESLCSELAAVKAFGQSNSKIFNEQIQRIDAKLDRLIERKGE